MCVEAADLGGVLGGVGFRNLGVPQSNPQYNF